MRRQTAAKMDPSTPATRALTAYLAGVNAYQDDAPGPMEFDIIGIPKRPFTPEDVFAVSGYGAYGFSPAFRVEPLMTYMRDKLGPRTSRTLTCNGTPRACCLPNWPPRTGGPEPPCDFEPARHASQLHTAVHGQQRLGGCPARTRPVGKPLLAGDPHIGFSTPSIWYEAHLRSPGFELYGHHQALTPFAMLGHNMQSGWTLTMFENDDIDLIAEKVNPANPNQVWAGGQWVDMTSQEETIAVKGAAPVHVTLRHSPHGPIINDALGARGRQDANCHVVGVSGNTEPAFWMPFTPCPMPTRWPRHALQPA